MKKPAIAIASAGAVSLAGLMLTMTSWVSGELKDKADRSEVQLIAQNVQSMDTKIDKVLWHLVSMKHTMDNGGYHGNARKDSSYRASDSSGAVISPY